MAVLRDSSLPSADPSAAVTFLPQAEVATGPLGTAKAGRARTGSKPGTSAAQDGTAESCRRFCGWLWPSDPMFTQGG